MNMKPEKIDEYIAEVDDLSAEDISNRLTGTTKGSYKHFNSAVYGPDVIEDIIKMSILQKGYFDKVGEDADTAKQDAADSAEEAAESAAKIPGMLANDNALDVIMAQAKTDGTSYGVSYEWNADGTCTVTGNGNGTNFSQNTIWYDETALPVGIRAGQSYRVIFKREKNGAPVTTNPNYIRLMIFYFDDERQQTGNVSYLTNDTTITIPSDAAGMCIRLFCSKDADFTGGELVTAKIMTALTNDELKNYIDLHDNILYRGGSHDSITPQINDYLVLPTYDETTGDGYDNDHPFNIADLAAGQQIYAFGTMLTGGLPVETSGAVFVRREPLNKTGNVSVFYVYVPSMRKLYHSFFVSGSSQSFSWAELVTDDDTLYRVRPDIPRPMDANDLTDTGCYFSSTTESYQDGTISNLPYKSGWLITSKIPSNTGSLVLQVFYPYYGTNDYVPKRRLKNKSGQWTNWIDFGGTGGNVNNFNFDITENTYNVNATPSISTGIPYVLTSTGDTTDRTADIAAVLTTNGCCILGAGTFYIDNLTLADYQSLMGSGIGRSVIRMADNASGTAITLGTRSSVSDLTISGGASAAATTDGGRNGLGWIGTFDPTKVPPYDGNYPERGQISNLSITGFSGAGIFCMNTSTHVATGLNAVNVNIYNCWAGINIPIYSEFHRFTNIEIDSCYYGVINNGGNNVFVNCGFNKNQIGFCIDNSAGQSPNNSHGSAIGCTFNHSGNNAGTAIKLDGVEHGYVFDGCQIHFGSLDIKDSYGVHFASGEFGRQVSIQINGGVVMFSGMFLKTSPTVTKTNTPTVITHGCYLIDTGAAITI